MPPQQLRSPIPLLFRALAGAAALVAVAALCEPASAQGGAAADSAASAERPGRSLRTPDRLVFATSAAPASNPSSWLGKTPGRGLFLTTVRATWRLSDPARERGSWFGYFAELIPLAVITNNPAGILPLESCIHQYPEWRSRGTIAVIEYFESCATSNASAYGVGITPVGLSARIGSRDGVALVVDASTGVILFDRSTPYPNTTQLNYNIAAGTSLEIPLRGRAVFSLGYSMHHFSNGGMGEFNPGILAHAVQLGWGRRR